MKNKHILLAFCFCLFSSSLLPTISYGQDGSLDLSFGTLGKVATNFVDSTADHAEEIAIQPDGKIVVVGRIWTCSYWNDIGLVRYNTNGSLDNTFGSDGIVITSVFGFGDADLLDHGNSIVIQSDGKIVVAGTIKVDSADLAFVLLRYNENGSLDNTFGVDGIVTVDLVGSSEIGNSVALQADGKIVVAGRSGGIGAGAITNFALIRCNPDGSLDNTFDSDGIVISNLAGLSGEAYSVAIQSDEKIVVAGYTDDGVSLDFAVARYNSDGSLDNTFEDDGLVILDMDGGWDEAYDVTTQSDGKILAAGTSEFETGWDLGQFTLVRYNNDGSLDNSFGGDGIVTTDFSDSFDEGRGVTIQSDNKIVVAGRSDSDFALARYNIDGSLDNSFDTDGLVTTDFSGTGDWGNSVAIQSDGKIVVAGYGLLVVSEVSSFDFTVARYAVFGLNETDTFSENKDLKLYPNPTSGVFNIIWNSDKSAFLRIFNSPGEEVYHQQITQDASISLLQKGIYVAKIDDGERTYIKKIVVQ